MHKDKRSYSTIGRMSGEEDLVDEITRWSSLKKSCWRNDIAVQKRLQGREERGKHSDGVD
jgi:hypothetical protein